MEFQSIYGQFLQMLLAFAEYAVPVAVAGIAVGLALCATGYRLRKIWAVAVCALLMRIATGIAVDAISPGNTVAIIGFGLAGSAVGIWLALFFPRVGLLGLGGGLGFGLGYLSLGVWGAIALGVVGAVLGALRIKYATMALTALAGACLFSFSAFFVSGAWSNWWWMLAVAAGLSLLGFALQFLWYKVKRNRGEAGPSEALMEEIISEQTAPPFAPDFPMPGELSPAQTMPLYPANGTGATAQQASERQPNVVQSFRMAAEAAEREQAGNVYIQAPPDLGQPPEMTSASREYTVEASPMWPGAQAAPVQEPPAWAVSQVTPAPEVQAAPVQEPPAWAGSQAAPAPGAQAAPVQEPPAWAGSQAAPAPVAQAAPVQEPPAWAGSQAAPAPGAQAAPVQEPKPVNDPIPQTAALADSVNPSPVERLPQQEQKESTQQQVVAKFCSACGAKRAPDARFCASCGVSLV